MGRILSSVLRQELGKLDIDPDNHKTAMRALKSYVNDLDARAIPLFVAQLSETKETGSEPGEFTVSLFEDLARAHGVKISPHTENIMQVIIRTLASSAGSFPLQQACSKVVSAIARYGIDPGTPGDKKKDMIHSLCKPLSDSLLETQGHLALGAVVCLKALMDCDNWRFASDEMVNKVCQNVAVTLEVTSSETNSYMALVMALAKHNPFIVEAYTRLLVHSGLRILNVGVAEGNSQKRLLAIQMLNFLMKSLDPKSMYSEIELILQEMGKFRKDPMHFVKMAAYEAMQTAKRLTGETGSTVDSAVDSCTGSNFSVGNHNDRISVSAKEGSIKSRSHDPQRLRSSAREDSPCLRENASYRSGNDRWSVNHKHGTCADVQADEDDLFPGAACGSIVAGFTAVPHEYYTEEIHVSPEIPRNGYLQSSMPCQIPKSHAEADDSDDILSRRSDMNSERFKTGGSRSSRKSTKPHSQDGYPRHHRHGFVQDPFDDVIDDREQSTDGSSSTCDPPTTTGTTVTSQNTGEEPRADWNSETNIRKGRGKSVLRVGLGFFSVAVAGFASFMWVYVRDDMAVHHLVPT